MNKGGAGGGGGPTAAAAFAAAQKQKTLQQRVDNDIGNIVDNFSFIVNVARVLPLRFFLFTSLCTWQSWLCKKFGLLKISFIINNVIRLILFSQTLKDHFSLYLIRKYLLVLVTYDSKRSCKFVSC